MSDLMDLRNLVRMARDTISDPPGGARMILSLDMPRAAIWLAFALMVVGTLIIGEVIALLFVAPAEGPLTGRAPLIMGLMQGGFLVMMVYAITYIGRYFGGHGAFDGALLLVTWLQFVFLLVQLVQLAVMVVLPPLGPVVTGLALALFLWLLVNFITVLHGFSSVGMVFVMTLVSFVVIVFALSVVLTILGISMPGVTGPGGV